MRGLSKKMLISILTSVIVFVTMVATTFAWVGIFTYSNTEIIQLNLKVNKSSNYYLTICSEDSVNKLDYDEEIPLNDLKKSILKNKNVVISSDTSQTLLDALYIEKTTLSQSTLIMDDNNNIDHFETMINIARGPIGNEKSEGYLVFDVYLTVNTMEGVDEDTTGINSNVVLDDIANTIIGKTKSYFLHQGNTIRNNRYAPSGFDWQLYPAHSSLTSIIEKDGVVQYIDKREIQVNSSSAARFALEVYNPIKLTDTYTGEETPINTIVYQGGSALPTYDEVTDVYSMGGILPEEYNFALQEVNALYGRNLKIPNKTLNYESSVRQLQGNHKDNIVFPAVNFEDIDTENVNYLGVMNGIQTKQKIRVYFWFEGWDSDCIAAIARLRTTLNITFTADADD